MSIRYFVRANTCVGRVNYAQSNLQEADKIYTIQSGFGYLKYTFISRLAAYMYEHGTECEYMCNPMRQNAYDGFVVPGKRFAVTDSELIQPTDNCVLIDIDSCINKKAYDSLRDYEKIIKSELEEKMNSVYSVYQGAKKIHDEWEQIYIGNMNFEMLDCFTSDTIKRLVPDGGSNTHGREKHRFFGAVYHDGNVNYIDNITSTLDKRYFIKGRPGTGKSTFLKKLVSALVQRGFDCEVYHCGFDPASLDMAVCRELGFCVFDSTAPHEKFPVEPNDEILDFYINSGLDGTDTKFSAKLVDVQLRYSKMMSLARLYLEEANAIYAESDDRIKDNIDFEALNNIVYEFLYEIF